MEGVWGRVPQRVWAAPKGWFLPCVSMVFRLAEKEPRRAYTNEIGIVGYTNFIGSLCPMCYAFPNIYRFKNETVGSVTRKKGRAARGKLRNYSHGEIQDLGRAGDTKAQSKTGEN
ncbi:hypothetical protein K7T73_21830 (plasmid) [Bacillus badius]|uniref:hypothetical protein n=1 Tax=Bacillus badius TaxID=1455 RepID=UPI001CBC239F|nr:hypothetical protein [Bacillus badius]UAT33114.1 hypothetical protein K7T73_21830 [Bacillus badius]